MADTIDVIALQEESAKERFDALDGDRTTTLDRARQCAKLTIPSVLPEDGHDEETRLETPYQATGARLVNNLASKLLLTLLPPNTPFFRLLMDDEVKAGIEAQGEEGVKQTDEAESKLIAVEQAIMKQIEREALRVPTFTSMKDLIVTGNSLNVKTETGLKTYKLTNYVVLRDFEGNVLEIVTRETVKKESLPENIVTQLGDEITEGDVGVYTRAVLKSGTWYEYQHVGSVLVEGSLAQLKKDSPDFPYIPLRWSAINGENYGRGLVEQYLGDFITLEGLSQMLIEASAVMARVIFGKKPGGVLDIDELNDAQNGQFVYGDLEQDISVLRVDKGNDLTMASNMVEIITRRLEQAFLVASSVARESERTTATEIRYMASDLEQSLGGVYSVLALEFQRPLANILLGQASATLKALKIEPVIVTGIEALGRNAELDKLRQFNSFMQELGAPEITLRKLNVGTYIEKLANALELDTTGLIVSDAEIQAQEQKNREDALVQQGAQGMVEGAVTEATAPAQQ